MTRIETTPAGMNVQTSSYRFELDAAAMSATLVSLPEQAPPIRLELRPTVNGQPLSCGKVKEVFADGGLGHVTWGPGKAMTLRMIFGEQYVVLWHELPRRAEGIKNIQPLRLCGDLRQVRNYVPDLDRFDIPRRVRLPVRIHSARQDYKQFFQLDGGNFMAPAYLLGFYDGSQYAGLGLAQVPASMTGMDVSVGADSALLSFDYPQPVTTAFRGTAMVVCLGLQDAQILDRYRIAIEATHARLEPHAVPATPAQSWWSDPIYTSWGDQVYRKHVEQGHLTDEAGSEDCLSAALVDEALAKLSSEGIEPRTIVLDEGWNKALGDWQADNRKFKGSLRKYIATKHAAGFHVLLGFNPFLAREDSELATQHPDWLTRNAKGDVIRSKRCGRSYVLPDWSNHRLRRVMAGRIRAMVTAKGLDADGIKLVGTKFIPPADAQLSDGKFGRGERYLLGVLRAVRAAVKAGKADAPVSAASLNPLMADGFDIVRLGNISEVNHELYVERARTASWLMPAKPIDTDDWACYQKVVGVETFLKALCGAPNIYSAHFRGDGRLRASGAAGGHPVQIVPEQYRVIATAWRLYQMSREVPRSHLRCDWQQMEFRVGLPPSASIRTLQGGSVLAIYADRAIHLGSLQEGPVILDVPWAVDSVEEISYKDGRRKLEFRPCLDGKILFNARSCRDEVLTYQVNRT